MNHKPKSPLRMADGGELMKRFASRQPTLRAADGGTYQNGEGGQVPGSGKGDKIPALYEPSEFVVSNAMMARAPGLRGALHDLRGNVLAAKGMTPEQADAKALGYDGGPSGGQDGQQEAGLPRRSGNRRGGERASLRDAGGEAGVQGSPGGVSDGQPHGTRTGLRGQLGGPDNLGGNASAGLVLRGGEQPRSRLTLRANDGFGFDPSKYTPPKVDPGTGAYTAGAAPVQPVAVPAQPEAPAAAKPSLREGMQAQTGAFNKAKYAATTGAQAAWGGAKSAYGTLRTIAPGLAAGAAGGYAAQQAQSIGDPANSPNGSYKPPSAVDQIPTDGYNPAPAKQPHNWFTDNETGRNVGNTISALSGVPVVGALGNTLRSAGAARTAAAGPVLGAALLGANESVKAGRAAPPVNSALGATNSVASGPAQPQTPTPRDPGQVNVTRQANGNLSFSGKDISGPVSYTGDGAKDRPGLRNPGSTFSVMPAQDTSSLTNPDGSTWSAGDNAIMAANLRDGVDKYRGTSRGQTQDEAAPKRGEFGYNHYMANKVQQDQIKATLRGQDLDYQGKLANNKIGMFNALREQGNKDRDFSAGRFDKGLEQSGRMDEQARGAFKNRFDTLDKDGKPVARPDLESAAYEEVMRQNPNWSQLDPTQRARQIANAADHVKLIGNARDHQNNSIWQAMGVANKDNPHGRMPGAADLKGAQLEEVGLWDGLTKARVGRGDYKLTTKSGQVMHFGRDSMSDDQLGYLERAGVIAGQPRK